MVLLSPMGKIAAFVSYMIRKYISRLLEEQISLSEDAIISLAFEEQWVHDIPERCSNTGTCMRTDGKLDKPENHGDPITRGTYSFFRAVHFLAVSLDKQWTSSSNERLVYGNLYGTWKIRDRVACFQI